MCFENITHSQHKVKQQANITSHQAKARQISLEKFEVPKKFL
jgi:hypothetical protein